MRACCIEMFEAKKKPKRNAKVIIVMWRRRSEEDALLFGQLDGWNATMKTFFRDRLAVMTKTMRRVHHASEDCKLITCQQTEATDMDLIKVTRKSRSEWGSHNYLKLYSFSVGISRSSTRQMRKTIEFEVLKVGEDMKLISNIVENALLMLLLRTSLSFWTLPQVRGTGSLHWWLNKDNNISAFEQELFCIHAWLLSVFFLFLCWRTSLSRSTHLAIQFSYCNVAQNSNFCKLKRHGRSRVSDKRKIVHKKCSHFSLAFFSVPFSAFELWKTFMNQLIYYKHCSLFALRLRLTFRRVWLYMLEEGK